MSNYKSSPYIPSFLRAASSGGRSISLSFADVSGSNINNENSFGYSVQGTGLKSTQQLNVDWSKFENHTFFMSAEAKVNLAFEQIINGFPFDGNRKEVEDFFSNLTGFDKWVFDRFPKFRGQLHFSGTQMSETSPTKGTYIEVKDLPGSLFPSLSTNTNAEASVINPKNGRSLSIEMQLKIPEIQTDGTQVILQKINSNDNHGFCIRLSPTVSTSIVNTTFDVFSGSSSMSVSSNIDKGIFNHLCFVLDKDSGLHNLKIYNKESLVAQTTSVTNIKDLNIDYADLLIGSGSSYILNGSTVAPQQTLSGSMDELRIFHSVRTLDQQTSYSSKSIYQTPDLKLYYKFNEPPPPLSPITNDLINSVVLDSSGNSLHAYISNFTGSLRQNALEDETSNMIYEKNSFCPVLFPAQEDVILLNLELLTSASSYDSINPNVITRLVPQHYLVQGAADAGLQSETQDGDVYGGQGIPGQGQLNNSQIMLSLLYIWAKFFDEIKLFLDTFSTLKTVDYDLNKSIPNNFLFDIAKHYGFFLPPLFTSSTVEQYISAENIDPLTKGNESLSLQSVQHEILRRILINLPAVIKSKGTQHSIKAFIRSIGIEPDSSMRFREYGGATYKNILNSREQKTDTVGMVNFSTGSLIVSPFLSGSRIEIGFPYPSGNFVQKSVYSPHGISNSINDGLLTSGSWTFECSYKYNLKTVKLSSLTQSLARFCVTGSGIQNPGLITNLVCYYDEISPKISLFLRPGNDFSAPLLNLSLDLPKDAIFNGDIWNISFGCQRNDSINSVLSSSYFLRAGLQNEGEISYLLHTSSYFYELTGSSSPLNCNAFRQVDLTHSTNASGSFICLGSNQTIPAGSSTSYRFLNNTLNCADDTRQTAFDGKAMKLRFWSKSFEENEWIEHIKNYQSLGVDNPLTNYNYEKIATGSFERLRLDSLAKQTISIADSNEKIKFLDFSENEMHLSGIGFPVDRNCITPEIVRYSHLSPYFDESISNEKIRVRGYKNEDLIDKNRWAQKTPVYEIVRSESPIDDARFSIDFSLVDALNKDIINIFSSFDSLQNYIGKPELLFSTNYPELETLRNVYFNRLKSKLNFKAFFEFYSWFDSSISTFIEQLVPRKTVFKGSNFLVESHVLERHKYEYKSVNNYEFSTNMTKDIKKKEKNKPSNINSIDSKISK
ncbi:MAG: hypothetical protein EBU90_07285 [Proteobacteria bacterium]|nr:hypothetical protein [Pseudomonadota bacterium]